MGSDLGLVRGDTHHGIGLLMMTSRIEYNHSRAARRFTSNTRMPVSSDRWFIRWFFQAEM